MARIASAYPITRTPISVVRAGAGPRSFWQASAMARRWTRIFMSVAQRSYDSLPNASGTTPRPDQQPNPSGQAGAGSKNRNKNKRKRKKRKRR